MREVWKARIRAWTWHSGLEAGSGVAVVLIAAAIFSYGTACSMFQKYFFPQQSFSS